MALERKDRVKDQTSTTGTGTVTIDGVAPTGYRTITAAHTTGSTLRYVITNSTGSEWEVGEGVWTSSTNTLTRVTVYASSNSGSLVSFSAGAKAVFTGPVAQDFSEFAPLASPALTGTPTAPTASAATNTTQIATTAYVFAERTNVATLTNKTLTDPAIVGAILEDVYTITDGAAFEIDPGNGTIQLITLGASRTPKGTNFTAGESVTLMVDDGTAYTLTWTDTTFGTSGVKWVGGSAPPLATSGYTVIELWKVSTQVYGALVGSA